RRCARQAGPAGRTPAQVGYRQSRMNEAHPDVSGRPVRKPVVPCRPFPSIPSTAVFVLGSGRFEGRKFNILSDCAATNEHSGRPVTTDTRCNTERLYHASMTILIL